MIDIKEAREEAQRIMDHMNSRLSQHDPDSNMLVLNFLMFKILDHIMDNVDERIALVHLIDHHYLIDKISEDYIYRAFLPKEKRFVTGGENDIN